MAAVRRIPTNHSSKVAGRSEWLRRERHLIALARGQHGVVALFQLRQLGFSDSGARGRIASGRLQRVHSGVYSVGPAGLTRDGRWMAAVLAGGEDAFLSHRSAAALHGLISTSRTAIDVTTLRNGGRSRAGIRFHRTRLAAVDREVVEGIPCTSVARTLLDVAADAPQPVVERACDQAEIRRVLDTSAVEALLVRRWGQPGTKRLALALGTRPLGGQIAKSELEERFLALCGRGRLPRPEVNAWIPLAGEEMKVDFLWRRERVVVEVDGFEFHRTRVAFRRDRRRDRVLRVEGWQPLRFTWEDVTEYPTRVTEELRSILESQGSRSPRGPHGE